MPTNKTIVGRFGAPHGVRGWIKIISLTDPADNLLHYPNWQIQQGTDWKPLLIEATQHHGKNLIVKLQGIDDRTVIAAYTHRDIAIDTDTLPTLQDNEYYWHELVGMQVFTKQNINLGRVEHLLSTGSNDVLIVKGERERLIPYTQSAIQSIDPETRCIFVDWDPDF